jgi:RNA 2',3'-cyclic 3'-phosphodiesterase
MPEEGTIRAFLAIDPPGDVLRGIADIQGELKKNIRGSINWVRREGIHLTLKFFGCIGRAHLSSIAEFVTDYAARTPPLNLHVQGLGVFPGTRRPRVLWIGVDGDTERLIALQKAIDQGLEACGFSKEERPFRAHLTLARIKSPQGLAGIEKMLAEKGSEGAGAFEARSLTLFKSDLTPKGATYTVLGRFPFKGS